MQYGLEEAIFLDSIVFWYRENRANNRNYQDGRWWTFNSVRAFADLFPYWSSKQLRRIIASCRDKGALLDGNYNEDQRDRTMWYTPSDALLTLYGLVEEDKSICPNGQIDLSDGVDYCAQTGTCNNVTCNTHVLPPIVPQGDVPAHKPRRGRGAKTAPDWKPERFEGFWRLYPVKKSKQAAIRAWDLLHPDDALLAVMGRALQRQLSSLDWQRKIREERGEGIPYPSTWLNGRRWEDEEPELPGPPDEPPPMRPEGGRYL